MRAFWYILGCIALLCGVIGIALPVVPTVPFLLVAAWSFAKSSPRLQHKILTHPTYGPPVRAWQERGAIGRIAKIWALGAMAAGVTLSYVVGMPLWVVLTQAAICTAVGLYVASRPTK